MGWKKSVWDLFHETFIKGDEIVLITDGDKIMVGKLEDYNEDSCFIREKKNRPWTRVEWLSVRFMSHDGFPVKKLAGADGSKLIEKLDTKDVQKAIREALTKDICGSCHKMGESNKMRRRAGDAYHRSCYRTVFGDPFMVEGSAARLLNPGGGTPSEEFEECLEIVAADGAVGHLFDLPTIYVFEGVR